MRLGKKTAQGRGSGGGGAVQDGGEEFKLTSFTHKERPNHFQNLRISTFSPRSPKKLPPCHEKQGSPLRGVVHPHHTGLAPSQHISIVVCVAKKAKKQTEISTLVRYCWRTRLYSIFLEYKKAAMLLLPGGGGT